MKSIRLLILSGLLVTLSGCAGLFIAGAATTANIVIDPRSTQEIWQDNNVELEVAGLANKEPTAKIPVFLQFLIVERLSYWVNHVTKRF